MGAGKSEAARMLAVTGFRIIDADTEAKSLMQRDPAILRQLKETFGERVCNGYRIRFAELGALVFASEPALRSLNAIVHPPLKAHLEQQIKAVPDRRVVLDAALLPLWDCGALFDTLLWIHAPCDVRVERVARRTGLSQAEVLARLALQERMLPEPPSPPWIRIPNDSSTAHLERLLREALGLPA
jgi:dephospho-CoA kinase